MAGVNKDPISVSMEVIPGLEDTPLDPATQEPADLGTDFPAGGISLTIPAGANSADAKIAVPITPGVDKMKVFTIRITSVSGLPWDAGATQISHSLHVGIVDTDVTAEDDSVACICGSNIPVNISPMTNDQTGGATWNDGGRALTITSVTQPAHGAVSIVPDPKGSPSKLIYTPDPNYAGNDDDQFSYTASNGYQFGSGTVKVACIAIQDITIEEQYWSEGPNTWHTVTDDIIWTTDEHRWSITVTPSDAAPLVQSISWYAEPDVGQDQPIGDGSVFATSVGSAPAIGNLPTGYFYVYPVATIAIQNQFVQVRAPGRGVTSMQITSVNWVPAAPGETNLTAGGTRIWPEKNSPDEIQPHSDVKLQVTVTPAPPIPKSVYIRVFDPDNEQIGQADPNDGTGNGVPKDNVCGFTNPGPAQSGDICGDLGMEGPDIDADGKIRLEIQAGQTSRTSDSLSITQPQPGNNFVAAGATNEFDRNSLQLAKSDGKTPVLVRGSPGIENSIPATHKTPIMEVWRTLWIESDSMDAPGASDGPFDGDAGCTGCDDPRNTPSTPTINALYNLLIAANIEVRLLPAQYNLTPTIAFQHNLDPGQPGGPDGYLNVDTPGRDVNSETRFWVIRMLGAYEGGVNQDNDPDGSAIMLGYAPQPRNTTYVFDETIRDYHDMLAGSQSYVVSLDTTVDRVSAHEALHRFFGNHGNGVADQGIMQPSPLIGLTTAADFSLTADQIRAVQRLRYPK